jgi:serine phosphatase RsbU (regulator of sigma subunit)
MGPGQQWRCPEGQPYESVVMGMDRVDRGGRRIGLFHAAPLLVMLLLLALTATVTASVHDIVSGEEHKLLSERANEVNLVISQSITTVMDNLSVLARDVGLGGPSQFKLEAQSQVAGTTSGNAVTLALLQPAGAGFDVVSQVGPGVQPAELASGPPARAIRAAEGSQTMSATSVYGSGQDRSIGFAVSAPGGLVVFQQSVLGPARPPSQAGTAPFSELEIAIYASAVPEDSQAIVATTSHLPLRGAVQYVPLMAGSTRWLTAVKAMHPLVGSLASSAEWVSLGVGIAGSILVFLLLEGMAYRRDAALRAFDVEHRFAETLQRRLLPAIPELVGLDVASSYVPGADHQQVGGDWFDVFELSSGQVAVVIGDVMGHDVEAAATMSQLRASLRSFAAEGGDPAWTIERLSGFLDLFQIAAIVTVIYGVLDPPGPDGSRRFSWANAGHLPPLWRGPDGEVTELNEAVSPLLGAPTTPLRPVSSRVLTPGSTLLFYTDGLVETQDGDITGAIARLRLVLSDTGTATAEGVCTAVLETQLPSRRTDDIALLVVKLDEPAPPNPSVTPEAVAGARAP